MSNSISRTHRGLPIAVNEKFNSRVDIIIPFYGQYKQVTRLIESIFQHTQTPYTIILVDDCSPNKHYTGEWLSNIKDIKVTRTPKQLGFGGAMLHGYRFARSFSDSSWVCFMQSDCVVEDPHWLQHMGESLIKMKAEKVRMISPLTNNASGKLFQQMSREDYLGSLPPDRTMPVDVQDYVLDINKEDPEYLSMYCFMCHVQLFERCGGFIRDYPYGWYEDMEFAYRMNKHGFKQAVCRSTWVHHEGEMTVRELWRKQPQTRKIMQEDNFARVEQDLQQLFAKS